MKKIFKSEQSGRSMVEMLGVLAIIGVLSVGGIAGYSKAMAKFKLTKAMDQLTMLLANIRTTYAGMQSYNGLTTANAITYGLAPGEMVVNNGLINAFGGSVDIGAVNHNGNANMGFAVAFNGLSKEACINLATSDWGTGIDGLTVINQAAAQIQAGSAPAVAAAALPMTLAAATAAGVCDAATDINSITWFLY